MDEQELTQNRVNGTNNGCVVQANTLFANNYVGGDGRLVLPTRIDPPLVPFYNQVEACSRAQELVKPSESGDITIVLFAGLSGVGKTALATKAIRMNGKNEGGVIVVDLAGSRKRSGCANSDVLRDVLESLGLAPSVIPASRAARITRFRRLTSELPAIVVVDGATSADEIELFAPGAPGSMWL